MAYANVHINRFKRNEILSIFLLLLFIAGVIHKKGGKSAHCPYPLLESKKRIYPIRSNAQTVRFYLNKLFGFDCSERSEPSVLPGVPDNKKSVLQRICNTLGFNPALGNVHASTDTSGIFFRDRLSSRTTASAGSSCQLLLRAPPTDFSSKSYSSSPPPSSSHPPGVWRKEGDSNP